ncbi:hypothetical protein [Kitasatospora sp. GP82]|uniref:hypothetical protein n=1 Tax=Kitasatospora sp. GP82 TaxID=3035089 RepID=UPI00247306E0|nr:hypothetical protein [Kitasatospora sp. GP82]MDH6129784.1 basic membrane lipoprotein Med (substrate-binding protein (PBP1-ABC) superfamily) [Kitasatospora sp. GP82]
MQQSANGKNVQRLVAPATDPVQAEPLLAGLISRHCDLVVTVGQPFGHAIGEISKASPQTEFTAIDPGLETAPPRTNIVSSNEAEPVVRKQLESLSG